uniref:Uncharacterized protein n=1 Tax=Cannabis sativa TaxID=3483 RepID=A0A803P9X3_CANSA
MEEDIKSKKTREEALEKEVESLESVALEAFYKFWKANPEGHFDYLDETKEAYHSYYVDKKTNKTLRQLTPQL